MEKKFESSKRHIGRRLAVGVLSVTGLIAVGHELDQIINPPFPTDKPGFQITPLDVVKTEVPPSTTTAPLPVDTILELADHQLFHKAN